MADLDIKNAVRIGLNHEYLFAIGQVGDRWVGFAKSAEMLFVFPAVSDRGWLGVKDRDRAILLTSAIAQDPESAYGGVDAWFIEPALRGDPEKLRCRECLEVGCQGDCEDVYYGPPSFEDDE